MIRKSTGILVIAVTLSSFSTQAAEVSLGGGSGWHNRIYIAAGVIAAIIAAGIALKFYRNKRPAGNQLGSGSAKTPVAESSAKLAASSEDASADKFVIKKTFESALAEQDRRFKECIDSKLEQFRKELAKAPADVSPTVQTQPTSSITPEQFEELSGQVSSLTSQLKTLRADVDKKPTDDDLKSINARINKMATTQVLVSGLQELQAKIDSMDAILKQHSSKAMTERLNALKTDLEAQKAVCASHNTVGESTLRDLEALNKNFELFKTTVTDLQTRVRDMGLAHAKLSLKVSKKEEADIREFHAAIDSVSKAQDTEKHVRFPSGLVSPKSSPAKGGESETEEAASLAVPPLVDPHAESVSA